VTLEHLQLFRDIAATRSISRAAQLNDVSQSAASQHLIELEKTLEVKLLDRSTRPLTLTEPGKLYLDYCKDAIRARHEFDVGLERLKGRVEGSVRVASIYSIGLSEMSRLEKTFRERFPEAQLSVDYLRPERVYQAVLNEQADLGLVSYPEPNKDIRATSWRDERMVVAMSPKHRLASHSVISPRDLDGASFVGFDDDLPISREVSRFFREKGVSVNLVLHFDNIRNMIEAVAEDRGVSILPDPILQNDIALGRVHAAPLEEPGLYRPIGVLQLRRRKPNRATQSFLHLLTGNGA